MVWEDRRVVAKTYCETSSCISDFKRFDRIPVEPASVWSNLVFILTVGLIRVGPGYLRGVEATRRFLGRLGTFSRPT